MKNVSETTGPSPGRKRLNDQMVPYRKIGRQHGVETQLQDAVERNEIPTYRLGSRWVYIWKGDFYAWLDSKRITTGKFQV